MEGQGLLWRGNSAWWALSPLKAARLFPDECLKRCMRMRQIWMSPMSVVAPSKCHRSGWYTAVMQCGIKAKTAANLLDISGKLTVKNYHCHLLSSSLEIAALDLCTRTDICVGLYASVSIREGEEEMWEKDDKEKHGCDRGNERKEKKVVVIFLFFKPQPFVSVCGFVFLCNSVTLCMFECVKTVHAPIQLTSLQVCISPTAGHKVTLCFYGCSPWCFT